jgi:large subunit ribosomal protein L6
MSRLGKLPVTIPEGVNLTFSDGVVKVKGPNGELSRKVPPFLDITVADSKAVVSSKGEKSFVNPYLGTFRSHIANMVMGVTTGWSKIMELVGVGFRAEIIGKDLSLTVGFSHPVLVKAPEGISFKVEKSLITISGADKEMVGQIADKVRRVRPPEPYKGKGIKYQNEYIRRKAGKAAKTQGAAA